MKLVGKLLGHWELYNLEICSVAKSYERFQLNFHEMPQSEVHRLVCLTSKGLDLKLR